MSTKHSLSRLRLAVKIWRSEYVSREVNRANQIAWLCAVERLGDKWILAQPVRRVE